MNYYPAQLKAILAYISALDAVEKVVGEEDHTPYMAEILLTDSDQTDYGTLKDEIGGQWSWFPAVKP